MATFEKTSSSRHAKITGDFGEALILYWLSRDGFECARVDHTGIDIIAQNPYTHELMGISVKSRSRLRERSDEESVTIPNDNFDKARKACEAFRCVPYFAFVVDAKNKKTVKAFIISMQHLLEMFPNRRVGSYWQMTRQHLEKYARDPEIKSFTFTAGDMNWWSK
jgi:Holliday junction resolvase-like predicted endonuclease